MKGADAFADCLGQLRTGRSIDDVVDEQEHRAPTSHLREALKGWGCYYRGRYAEAAALLRAGVEQSGASSIPAWCALGLAKVATDVGYLQRAVDWTSLAGALAREAENIDLVAQAAGARGEVFLRAGFAKDAAVAFSFDQALLPPGSSFRGRLLCYRAHALSRLGLPAWPAAEFAYRVAIHTPGEQTDGYACAGLALLGARWSALSPSRSALTVEASALCPPTHRLGSAWCAIAVARVEVLRGVSPEEHLRRAWDAFPDEYPFERVWVGMLAASLGVALPIRAAVALPAPKIDSPTTTTLWARVTVFDRPGACVGLPDQGFAAVATDVDLWALRDRFMP